ncbi:CfaE/CblD family pilus tip adhesin [Pseudomonas poae]|uniref:CblD like pilus biogenesis initiator n=1 Tax=Pseudomonas poae TaxID=200451 RepID=A0ABY0RFU3_9PSED|nr:CfaE/CblD family pilus tip adhesin [Pseudomonas poae]SDO00139.1 CblD like pilus biogenesis initiator [Pseudomonas poae]
MKPSRNPIKISLSILLFLYSIACLAKVSPPSIPVTNRTDTKTTSIYKDLATDISIWSNVSGGKGSINSTPQPTDDYNYYSRMSWACTSSSDKTFGACATAPVWAAGSTETPIDIEFTEKKTGIKQVLSLSGYNVKANYNDIPVIARKNIYDAVGGDGTAQSLLSIYISKQQLEKLPIGGTWKASLVLNQWRWDPNVKVAKWTANITLNVIDRNNIQIYLPNYNTASPTVDLKLKSTPGAHNDPTLSGNVSIDACLYDGYNAQSNHYYIIISDPNSKDKGFYITNKIINPNPKFSNTIPYQVWVSTPVEPSIASKQVLSNQPFVLANVAQSTPQLVTLPNVPKPVYCTPWLINLKTANIKQKNQASGRYQGSLHLKFTVPSSSL